MTFIVTMIFVFILSAAFFAISRFIDGESKVMNRIGLGILLIGVPFVTIANSMVQVSAGHVGIVYNFGAIEGQTSAGLRFVLPWKRVVSASTQIQSRLYSKLDSFSKETQNVFIEATVNFHVSPQNIQRLYRTVGPDYANTLIDPRVYQDFKDATVLYSSVNIAPNRDNIRKNVRERITNELQKQSIIVDDVLIKNIAFSKEFEDSIENKQIQSQNALASAEKVKIKRQQAQQAIETAKGEAESNLIKAKKQAEANKIVTKSLSNLLIKYDTVQKLAPNVRVLMIPTGSQFILGSKMMNKK